MSIKYTNIFHYVQDPPKFTQSTISGLKPEDLQQSRGLASGLLDFSWYIIPKWGKNQSQNLPNGHKTYQMAVK
jgi:hypothetical protein